MKNKYFILTVIWLIAVSALISCNTNREKKVEDAEKKVKEVADLLGFDWNKKIITPAAQLYAKVYGISVDEALTRLNNISFKNNPFEGMKKVWAPKTQQEG